MNNVHACTRSMASLFICYLNKSNALLYLSNFLLLFACNEVNKVLLPAATKYRLLCHCQYFLLRYFISEAIALQVNNVVTNASFRPTTRGQKHTPRQLLVARTSRQCLLGIHAAAWLNRPQLVCKGTRVAYVSILLQANYNYYAASQYYLRRCGLLFVSLLVRSFKGASSTPPAPRPSGEQKRFQQFPETRG